MWLLLAFLLVPLIEIALFIQIGGAIGLWATLLIVVLTAIVGTWLVRSQGLATMNALRSSFEDLGDPTEPLAHGAMILFAGALLLTPGFFTDAVGFALLIPGVRTAIIAQVGKRVQVERFRMGPGGPATRHRAQPDDGVIEGEFSEIDAPPKRPTHQPSGWTRRH